MYALAPRAVLNAGIQEHSHFKQSYTVYNFIVLHAKRINTTMRDKNSVKIEIAYILSIATNHLFAECP